MKRVVLGLILAFGWGTAQAACPTGAIDVPLGTNIQTAIDAAPAGAKFCIGVGSHRGQAAVPKNNQEFYGAAGSQWLGSKSLTGWTAEGSLWYSPNQTTVPPQTNINECASWAPLCNMALAVYYDTEPLLQVASKGAVTSGKFWWDQPNGRIYIADDPAGKQTEVTTTEHAFSGSATGVIIKDMKFRRYGPRLQTAVIHGASASGWTIDNVTVLDAYAVGIDMGNNFTVRNSLIDGQGEMGMAGSGTGLLVENTTVTNNGYWAGLDPAWEGGGGKWTEIHGTITTVNGQPFGTGLTIRNSTFSGNHAVGIWLDEGLQTGADNSGVVILGNTISGNDSAGVSIEITDGSVLIDGNAITGNGVTAGWFWGGCVQMYDSKGGEIRNNTCDASATNSNGMMVISQGGRNDPEDSGCGNNFHHNVIILRDSNAVTGATGDNIASWCSGNPNVFNHNTYYVATQADLTRPHWAWLDDERTWAQFQALGQEANGTITVGVP